MIGDRDDYGALELEKNPFVNALTINQIHNK